MFCVLKNIVKNIDVDVFSKKSPKHRIVKEKARCFTWCFWFQELHPELWQKSGYLAKNVTLKSLYIPTMHYFCLWNITFSFWFEKFVKFSGIPSIVQKTSLICIVSTIFWIFSNIVKNIEVDVLSKTSAENRIVKNWKTSNRQNIASLRKVNIAHP